jgi:hypothetical protein
MGLNLPPPPLSSDSLAPERDGVAGEGDDVVSLDSDWSNKTGDLNEDRKDPFLGF